MAAATVETTIKPRGPVKFTNETASKMGLRSVSLQRARKELLIEATRDGTVCRDKVQRSLRLLLTKLKPTKLKVNNIKDFATLYGIADSFFGWSAAHTQRHEHLHLHTSRQLEDDNSTPTQVVDSVKVD